MKRLFRHQVAIIVFFLILAISNFLTVASAYSTTDDNDIEVGLPDLPRRVERVLPGVSPEKQITLGALKLHPSYKTEVKFDDNIRLSNSDEREDVIFTQRPGVIGELKLGDHNLEAGYGMEIVNYAKDQEENAINHMAHAQLDLNFNDLKITARDLFEVATSRLYSETSERDRLKINTVDIMAAYDRPNWTVEGGWRNNVLDHAGDLKRNDYFENILFLLEGYKISDRTLVLIETDLGFVDYQRDNVNPNHKYWQIFGGFRSSPTEKITANAKVGYQGRYLEDIPGTSDPQDYHGVVANTDLTFTMTEKDIFRTAYIRTVRISTFADNAWYRQDKISLSYTKRFLTKWSLTPNFGWQFNDYPEEATRQGETKYRDDHYWIAGINLRYDFRDWLSSGLAYNFRDRNSNFDNLDYENNKVTFDITLAY